MEDFSITFNDGKEEDNVHKENIRFGNDQINFPPDDDDGWAVNFPGETTSDGQTNSGSGQRDFKWSSPTDYYVLIFIRLVFLL